MDYTFVCDTRPKDFWLMVMENTYRSVAGVCNIIFTISMFILLYTFHDTAGPFYILLNVLGCMLFLVIQPLSIYKRAIKQVSVIPENMRLSFSNNGIEVCTQDKKENIQWKKVKHIANHSQMIIISVGKGRGYILSNRVLKDEKDAFYQYLLSSVNQSMSK